MTEATSITNVAPWAPNSSGYDDSTYHADKKLKLDDGMDNNNNNLNQIKNFFGSINENGTEGLNLPYSMQNASSDAVTCYG